ncbi:phage T7 F exclusion suppressor FxsA [compost metagenome]
MLLIPFPFFIAELVIFIAAVQHWGFWTTVGYYLLPSLLGIFIVSTIGRVAMMSLQSTVGRGQLPANKILHSGALFISGLLFLVPSFFTRVFAVLLFLPGTRHLLVWRFKLLAAKKIAEGSAKAFNFGGFGFGTGGGSQGFKYYQYRGNPGDFGEEFREERDVTTADVLDVKPIEITHEKKEPQD